MPKVKRPSPEVLEDCFRKLEEAYPNAKTELLYENPFELIIAVILSAQCTDARVNMTTPALFAKYPDAPALAKAKQSDVEKLVKSCGFYRMKAQAIIATAKDLVEKFAGKVPKTLEELTTLRGVGRKTASVVLNQAFDLPAIAVDTHVARVSQRLGWATNDDPVKIEFELRDLIPMERWGQVNTLLILHGRRICNARKPLCEKCFLAEDCPSAEIFLKLKAADESKGKTRSSPRRGSGSRKG